MNHRRVTMSDVAAKLGISSATVGLALRGHHRVSEERRREVQRVAKEMGYTPDPFLPALAAHRQQRVAIKDRGVIAWINHWEDPKRLRQFNEFDAYWQGASKAANQFGYHVDEVRWEPDCPPKRLENILLTRGIEGVLIPPHGGVSMDWGDFDWSKFSVVRFGLTVPHPNCNAVTADGYRATVMAITKIYEYGYRRIGITVNQNWDRWVGGELQSGYFYAQKLLQLKPALPPLLTNFISRVPEELSRQKAALAAWLKQYKPDAVITSDIEVPGLIQELGYRIPQDIAVAGAPANDIPGVDTGVDHHAEAIGRVAVETLLKQMNIGERGEPRSASRILIESRWKDGSTLPPAYALLSRKTAPIAPTPPLIEMAGRRITLKDIAEKVGVTKTAVSLALRDSNDISGDSGTTFFGFTLIPARWRAASRTMRI